MVEGWERVGRITGVAKPDHFTFTFDPQRPVRLYDYVVIEMEDMPPGSEEPVKVPVVAQVYSIERAGLGLSPEHPWPVVRELTLPLDVDTPRAVAKILGYRWKGRIYRPRSAPQVGSWVYRAPDKLLEEFFAVDKPRRLHIGYLISRPSVPAYIDVEGLKRHLAIIAATGAGKTWTSVVLIEELLKKNATILVLDPHGEYVAMKPSACAKMREFCGRIRVVKAHKDQVGDVVYKVNVLDMSGDELADVAGVPSRASRVRTVISAAKTIADLLTEVLGDKKFGDLKWIKEVISAALNTISLTKIQALKGDTRFQHFKNNLIDEILRRIQQTTRYSREFINQVRKELLAALEYDEAVKQLYLSISKDAEPANSALRYLSSLESIGVYSTTTVSLDDLLSPGTVTVVNLAGLPLTVQDHIVSSILRRVFEARVRAMRGLPGEAYHYPIVVIMEEAHRFAPAQGNVKTLPVATMVASEGRKFGVFLVVITQRPSRIHPDVLSQAQSQIILRIVNPKDQQAVRDASEQLSQELFENLPGLNPGEAIVVGPIAPLPMMVRVRDRVLDYAGTDISLVEAWGRSIEEAKEIERITAELVKKLSEIVGYQVEPSTLHNSLAMLLGAPIDHRLLKKALKLVAARRVTVYGFDRRWMRLTGRVQGFEVEVSIGGRRRCECGADSTENEEAICPHMLALVIQAILEGLVSTIPIVSGEELIDEI